MEAGTIIEGQCAGEDMRAWVCSFQARPAIEASMPLILASLK
jgi:hypothetical protein